MWRRLIRNGLIAFAVLLVLVVAAGALAIARFDPNTFKPRIAAAVKQATGRELALNGPISLRPSLWPTVELRDVTFANPPGFSRPDMATLQRLDVQLALWPLLFRRLEIDRLVLVRPDIRMEANAKGQTNWMFSPSRTAASGQPNAAPQPAGAQPAMRISVDHLRIEDGTLSYRDDVTGRGTAVALHRLDMDAASPQARLHLKADATYLGAGVMLDATLGPIERLLNPGTDTPWPVQGTIQTGAAKLTVDGSLRQPLRGLGYDVALTGNIPDLAALAPFVPGTTLPPLRDVRFSTRLRDRGAALPDVTTLTLHVGASDLGSVQPGLRLDALDVTAPALNQPMQVRLQAQLAGAPLKLAGTFGPPSALMDGGKPGSPYPIDLTGQAAGADVAVKGTIAQPAALKGVDLQLRASAADLAALTPVVRHALPALKSVAFSARVMDAAGGLAKGVALHDLKLTMPQGDLSGDLGVTLGTPPDVAAKLTAERIDADALLAAFRPAGSAPSTAAPPGPTAPQRTAASERLFPDTRLPFGLLRSVNADVAVTAREVQTGGAPYRNVAAHLVLRDGKLRLEPFTADLPQGHVALTLSADDITPAPAVALTMRAPALALQPLLAALHQPAYATGNLEVLADLHGTGDSPHAIAADLDGSLGLAMEHGTADTTLLEKLLGPTLAKANLLGLLARGGTSQVECFAFRMDARHGIGEVRTLVLSSSLLSLDGSGSVNLGNETVALDLRPQGRVAGTGLVVPLRVAGSLRDPAVTVNAAGTAGSNIGSLAGALAGSATPLGAVAGVLIGGQATGSGESCPGPLAIARGQKPPEQPARAAPASAAPAPAAPAPAAQPKAPNPANLLRQLFR